MMVIGNALQDTPQSTDFDRLMARNYFMMLAAYFSCHPYVGSPLTSRLVTQFSKSLYQLIGANIAGNLHRVSTSSRTK